MKAIYLMVGLFVASAWGYEAEQYRQIEATYINKIRDLESRQPVLPDQTFTVPIFSATFNDEGVIYTFNINKVKLGDNIPFCDMTIDVFTVNTEDHSTAHSQAMRIFQMKMGHLLERQVSSSFTNTQDEAGRLKTTFEGNYPKDAFALTIRQVNSDGSGTSEKSYYNMNQVMDDSIVDYENIVSKWKVMARKSFLMTLPLGVRRFVARFIDVHLNAVMLQESLKKCETESPDTCGNLKTQREEAVKIREQTWASFSSNDAFTLRPVSAPMVMRPRPLPQSQSYFGRFFAR